MGYRQDLRRTKYFQAVKRELGSNFDSKVSEDEHQQVLYNPRSLLVLPPPSDDPQGRVDDGLWRRVTARVLDLYPQIDRTLLYQGDEMPRYIAVELPAPEGDRAAADSFSLALEFQEAGAAGQVVPEYYTLIQQYVQPGEDPDPSDPVPGLGETASIQKQSAPSGPGEGIRIAVLDTGVADGVDRVFPPRQHIHGPEDVDELHVPSAAARPSSSGLPYLAPCAGHGTHICALIHLVAPGATVISIKVASPLGLADETKLAKGIDRAVAEGADIINLSLGGYPFVANREWPAFPAFGLLKQKIDELPSKTAIVAAAGNSGSSAPFYPAAFHDQVIGVAALDAKGSLWARSNYGDWVRACARGAGLRSLFVKGEEDPDFLPDAETPDVFGNDLNYAAWSGTSFAAPLVAAQIAIVAREFGIDDMREAAEHLLAMSLEPYGTLPCGKRVLVNVPGQT